MNFPLTISMSAISICFVLLQLGHPWLAGLLLFLLVSELFEPKLQRRRRSRRLRRALGQTFWQLVRVDLAAHLQAVREHGLTLERVYSLAGILTFVTGLAIVAVGMGMLAITGVGLLGVAGCAVVDSDFYAMAMDWVGDPWAKGLVTLSVLLAVGGIALAITGAVFYSWRSFRTIKNDGGDDQATAVDENWNQRRRGD